MYKIITFIFFICFYQTFTQAEIINKITVSGNQRVSFETICFEFKAAPGLGPGPPKNNCFEAFSKQTDILSHTKVV